MDLLAFCERVSNRIDRSGISVSRQTTWGVSELGRSAPVGIEGWATRTVGAIADSSAGRRAEPPGALASD